ncbi:aminodeoxychorismate lyase [Siminovitchia acidinfaciens]|uniref:Aminodeoxychorismate lyase n=1 Tax=Siminovitchia acidinfaciens TaxID=2321395 RepID=A0A429XX04_9BACI|nr:aminodeoxychorismate lyase [Siminovitchia acidinfaciens]RST73029.1 aminodeoxychorismate lyase [Siminovitchia acidinfaciens]
MRFNSLASFAAGILLATSVSSAAYFSVKGEASNLPVKKEVKETIVETQLSEEEMKAELESSGFIVQTTGEYDKNIEEAIEEAKKAVEKEKPEDEKKVVYRVVINVTDGMTSIDVGRMLVKAKIIDDAFKFSKAVEKKKVENRLRPGSYEVDSEMSRDEVIAAIFK